MMYITRVELFDTNDGTSEEYTKLHEAMASAGFKRTIVSNEGVEYHLPPAEYFYGGELESSEVCILAQQAARKSGKKFSVLLTKAQFVRYVGLKKVA